MFCQRCGNPTEERPVDGRLRPVCTGCDTVTYLDPKLAVAILVEEHGKLLLGKRADWVSRPGFWSFPAGFVERGEVVEDAAIRETLEETGLSVTVDAPLGVFSETGNPVALVAYPALTASGTLLPADDLIELAWHAPDDLPQLAFDHDLDIVRAWQRWRGLRAFS